jgi:hypothetical protein
LAKPYFSYKYQFTVKKEWEEKILRKRGAAENEGKQKKKP